MSFSEVGDKTPSPQKVPLLVPAERDASRKGLCAQTSWFSSRPPHFYLTKRQINKLFRRVCRRYFLENEWSRACHFKQNNWLCLLSMMTLEFSSRDEKFGKLESATLTWQILNTSRLCGEIGSDIKQQECGVSSIVKQSVWAFGISEQLSGSTFSKLSVHNFIESGMAKEPLKMPGKVYWYECIFLKLSFKKLPLLEFWCGKKKKSTAI